MSDKTVEELELEITMRNCQESQRTISDGKYATQKDFSFIQKIVFSFITLILLAVAGSWVKLAIK
jgi:hypothetical protein